MKQPQTYYVIVSVEDRLPTHENWIPVIDKYGDFVIDKIDLNAPQDHNPWNVTTVTHWLSEQQGVVLSVEEWNMIIETLKTCSYSNVDYESQQVAAKQALSQLNKE